MKKNKKAISFFSNAGIGDLGIEKSGIDIVYANELLKERSFIYKHNHPHTYVHTGDINELNKENFNQIHTLLDGDECFLLVATPPCQGFSNAGKRDKFDIRNQLLKPVMSLIKEFKPQFVLMENVPRFQKGEIPNTDNIVFEQEKYDFITIDEFMKNKAKEMGYHLYMKVINMQDYGVPQSRKRVFTIFSKEELVNPFPIETHKNKPVTVRDAIGHLPSLEAGERCKMDEYHFTKPISSNYKRWLEVTPEGHSAFDNEDFDRKPTTIDKKTGERRLISCFGNAYKRMWWDKPAPTITMSSGTVSSQTNVHPKDSRVLSIREIMLLQTIPTTYTFPKGTSEKKMRDVIGEAVPPLMFELLAEHLLKINNEMNDFKK